MQAAQDTVPRRRHRFDETTNGHTPGAEQLDLNDYPSSSEEDEHSSLKQRKDQARLRVSTPQQLLQDQVNATERSLFVYLLLFRCVAALITSRTVFAPDEHWQSLEVAHRFVFGYGYETWEWRDPRSKAGKEGWGDGPIRSPIYPAMFVLPYWLMQQLGLDNTRLLTVVPSVVQAILAAFTDLYTFKLARKLLNERAAWITLIPLLLSLYTFHTSTRTLSNSTEAAFTIIAFYYWPLSLPENSDDDLVGETPLVNVKSLETSLIFFALSTVLRPSNVLISLPLFVILVKRILGTAKSTATLVESAMTLLVVGRTCLFVGLITVVLLTIVDSLCYGRLTFTPIAFLKRNVLESISLFYGQSPVHFYLSSAMPFICFSTLPYTLHGIYSLLLKSFDRSGFNSQTRRWYGTQGVGDATAIKTTALVSLLFIASMSLLGHKEIRFLQPIVPLLHIFEGYALSGLPSIQTLISTGGRTTTEEQAQIRQIAQSDRNLQARLLESLQSHSSARNRRHILSSMPTNLLSSYVPRRLKQACKDIYSRHGKLSAILLGAHILPIIYLSFHSAGQVSVVETVGNLGRSGQLDQVVFLMPCHSTPWMSHIHDHHLAQGNNSWFISCEPPLDGQDITTYKDESDYFYDDPYTFIEDQFSSTNSWPSHIALFECLLDVIGPSQRNISVLLSKHGYSVQFSWWNSLFHLDHRRRGRVLLLRRNKRIEHRN